jgi:asparagine synthase (glutamine-hydrolysing)
VALLTVGFESSHDMEYSAVVAGRLQLPHHTGAISDEEFRRAYRLVDGVVPAGRPLSWRENCIAFHFVAGLAAGLGLERVVAANGIDELFCGYDSYRRIYNSGEEAIGEMIRQKTANEVRMADAMREVAGRQGVLVEQPLLGNAFVEFSGTVPLREKITGSDDYLRKHAVRRAAALAGLPPDICLKRKKALQYGTRIHPRLIRMIRRGL